LRGLPVRRLFVNLEENMKKASSVVPSFWRSALPLSERQRGKKEGSGVVEKNKTKIMI
jgi:hypothetical protein